MTIHRWHVVDSPNGVHVRALTVREVALLPEHEVAKTHENACSAYHLAMLLEMGRRAMATLKAGAR